MRVTPAIRSLIQANAASRQIEAAAREDDMQTLGELGRMKLEPSFRRTMLRVSSAPWQSSGEASLTFSTVTCTTPS
jgi:hypothetical protein